MARTIAKRELTANEVSLIGKLLFEILAGNINQETWDALYGLGDLREIPQPCGHLISYAQGYALDGISLAHDLQDELRIIGMELTEPRREYPNAIGVDWISMYTFLQHILEGGDPDTSLRANIDAGILPEVEKAPAWARPLIQYAQASSGDDRELSLGLLDILENIIKKRKEQLS